MSLPSFAVRRPVATSMVFLALTTLGIFAYLRLQVDVFPELDFPSISVVATYPGAGPEEMETLMTRPIERAVAQVEGIDRLESFSSEGRARVALRFDWGVPLESALNDVRAAVERVRAELPDDADPPNVYKFDVASFPILFLGLSADMGEAELQRFAEYVVQPRLERVPGVASVTVRGAREREIRIEIDPERLAALRIPLDDVRTALRNENLTVPAGIVEDGDDNVLLRAASEFRTLESIEGALVTTRDGVPIRVRDVARVNDTLSEVVNLVRVDGVPGVQVTIVKSPDANTIEVADGVYDVVADFNEDYVGTAALSIISDSSTYIRQSIESVWQAVLIGAALAIIVLLVFLRSVRTTFVVGIAIPISIVATFFLMDRFGLTLNLISFGGLAVGLGMLVDNSIVILENIYRRITAGEEPHAAAVAGAQEMAPAIVASTATTIAVFAPVAYLGGFAAVFFGEMALVVTASLLCSLLVALTVVPTLAARILRPQAAPEELGRRGLYARFVAWSVRRWYVVLPTAAALLAGTVAYFGQPGSELLPETDEGEVRINAEYPPGTRIEVTLAAVERLERAVRANVPEVDAIVSTLGTPGFWSSSGEESAQIRVLLQSPPERTRTSAEIAASLGPLLGPEVPGMRVFARPGGGLFLFKFLRRGDSRVRVDVRGYDLDIADALAAEVVSIVSSVDGVTDARSSRQAGGRELTLTIDRDRAADLGLTTRELSEAVSTLVQGSRAGVFRSAGDEHYLVLRMSESRIASLDGVLATPIVLRDGRVIQLRDVTQVAPGTAPRAIERFDQERIISVGGGIETGRDLGSINAEIRARLREVQVPDGFALLIAGEGDAQDDAFGSLNTGILLALLLVFMVMAAQFESVVQPILVMASVPFAAIGVLIVMALTGTTLNLNSFMGVIVLVGVVVNNAIVLVDTANQLRATGLRAADAAVESAARRLRPILMTSATTVLGLLPIAIGLGTGSETQAPLARVVVGGLTSSTLVTLVVIPVVYAVVVGFLENRGTKSRASV